MKTITLKFKHSHGENKPQRWQVEYVADEGNTIGIMQVHTYRDKSQSTSRYEIKKQADGSWRSNTTCEYVEAKFDTRKKPFSVDSWEFGRGPKSVHKFATTAELSEYVRGRWQGWEYYDGGNSFHNDYCTFVVNGANLADLVPADGAGLVKRCSELEAEVAAENGYSEYERNS